MASSKEPRVISMAKMKTEAHNRETYGEIIRANRIRMRLNQPQLAAMLGTTKNAVSNWESGFSRPDMNLVPGLCQALGISIPAFFGIRTELDALTPDQLGHIRSYVQLSPRDQSTVNALTEHLLSASETDRRVQCRSAFLSLFHNDNLAAAGLVNDLDDSVSGEYEYIRRDGLSERADEIITVTGDSMEPTFHDGDDLLIQHTETLEIGEIGIFVVNGEGFVKEYRENGLYSHNSSAYPLRTFSPNDDVRIVGRVLGKVTDSQRPTKEEAAILDELILEGSL